MVKSKKHKITEDTCYLDGAFSQSECTWAMEQSTILTEVGLVGQVDLVLTNIGPKMLHLDFKITVKVLGNEYLEETTV